MRIVLLILLAIVTSCTDSSGGFVRVRASGLAAAASGYPHTEGDTTVSFADDFAVTFDNVLVCLEAFALESADGTTVELPIDPVIFDLRDSTTELWQVAAPLGSFSGVSFRTRGARHSDRIVGDIADNEIHYMLQNQLGVYVVGRATKGSETFRFFLGFPAMHYVHCENGLDPAGAFEVDARSPADVELSFHLDHMFYDSLASETGRLRFEPFAAAAFSNDVTTPFLSQQLDEIVDRNGDPIREGQTVVEYDPGPFTLSPSTFESYFVAAGRTLAHVNGAGRCETAIE